MNLRTPTRAGSFADAERDIINRALEVAKGNRQRAARMLKSSRQRLYAKIAKYGLAEKRAASAAGLDGFIELSAGIKQPASTTGRFSQLPGEAQHLGASSL